MIVSGIHGSGRTLDGNGRLSRFMMNLMLASSGYTWTVIRVDRRREYLDALGCIDIDHDFLPFTTLIAEEMETGGVSGVGA